MNDKKKSRFMHDDGLFIHNRQLSLVASGILVCAFFIFMGGYFVGKNTLVEPFMARVEQGVFADQIYSSLCARYDQNNDAADDEESIVKSAPETIQLTENTPEIASAMHEEVSEVSDSAVHTSWYAPLIGYAKEQHAEAFAEKLRQKGIAVAVKKHQSKTPKGKGRHWYQVVTEPYKDQAALQVLVNKIAQEEKIKNIKILELA
jgi:hypothetical protein